MRNYRIQVLAVLLTALLIKAGHSQPPESWSVNPNIYQYSMTFTTLLKTDEGISEDPDDVIAAFIDNECRGVARPSDSISATYNNVAFLMVYSNRAMGDTIRFKIYDADKDSIFNIAHRALFQTSNRYGLPSRPLVNIAERKLIALNFFTPNNDGYNDYWKIKNKDIYIDYKVYIYDSNGQQVYNKDRLYRNKWDGTHNGQKLPEGVYYYLVKDAEGNVAYKGTISLVR